VRVEDRVCQGPDGVHHQRANRDICAGTGPVSLKLAKNAEVQSKGSKQQVQETEPR